MQFKTIHNLEGLRQRALEWNRLHAQASVGSPAKRSEPLCYFINTFANEQPWQVAMVENRSSEIVAALGFLVERKGPLRIAKLLQNPWASCADLMLLPGFESNGVQTLLKGFNDLGIDLLWLDWINEQGPNWSALLKQIPNASRRIFPQYHVGLIETDTDFESYFARTSKGHRKKIRSRLKKLGSRGDLEFRFERHLNAGELESRLKEIFDLEHRGWKGKSGTSVHANAGCFQFYGHQAIALSRSNSFAISELRLDGKLVAYEYGYLNQRTYYSHKVGYDETYSDYSPGHLMTFSLPKFSESFSTEQGRIVDTEAAASLQDLLHQFEKSL